MLEPDFHPVDLLFAERLCPEGPSEASFFLASLLKSAREGHMYLSADENETLRQGAALLPNRLFEKILVKKNERIYLQRNWEFENRFLTHLQRLIQQKPKIDIPASLLAPKLEREPLNLEQKQAILKAAKNAVTLITGGPGTGKTHTAAALIRLFVQLDVEKIVIAAPTGKATANMRSALGKLGEQYVFKTLHALTKQGKIYADLVIVDEGSMVDAERMAALFSSVQEGARLVLLGDKDQLPPIESGNFFSELATLQELVTELKICLRCELSEILNMAATVKKGLAIPSHPLPDIPSLLNCIVDQEVQVLTPLRKGLYGVDHLNQRLYREYQKRGAKKIPIMITVNDPHQNLFNGDIGVLDKEVNVAYFSEERKISEYCLPPYEYAYAVSVHKSQGSEYDNTLILLPEGSEIFGREMLYTAITRAKKQMTLLAHEGVVEQIVKTHCPRRSGVADALVVINSLFNNVA